MAILTAGAGGRGAAGLRSLGLGLLASVCLVVACLAAPLSEYDVKAVFLFNFAQFVEWPTDAFPAPEAPFVIGVLGKDPFGSLLDSVVRGEVVTKRPIAVERYGQVDDIAACNILFIPKTEVGNLSRVLAALHGRSILTVTDAEDADQTGVMIQLVNRNNHIRLRINLGAARAARLVISSKLLRPAEIVGGAG